VITYHFTQRMVSYPYLKCALVRNVFRHVKKLSAPIIRRKIGSAKLHSLPLLGTSI